MRLDLIAGKWNHKKQDQEKMKHPASITVWKDHEAASVSAAHHFVILCQQAIAKHGRFTVALSGGNTPKRFYQLLATHEFSKNIPWQNVFLFWSDERFVPYTDPDSNFRMVKENLLDHIPIPAENIFPVPVDGKAKAAAKGYEKMICSFFKKKKIIFDCILLGIGDDGHTASLFPGTNALKEMKRLVTEVWVEEKQSWRISFTFPLINNAGSIVFLVTGKEKAAVFARIIAREKTKPVLPVQLVKPLKGIVFWILDEEATAKI